jgi:hypothetical protein
MVVHLLAAEASSSSSLEPVVEAGGSRTAWKVVVVTVTVGVVVADEVSVFVLVTVLVVVAVVVNVTVVCAPLVGATVTIVDLDEDQHFQHWTEFIRLTVCLLR